MKTEQTAVKPDLAGRLLLLPAYLEPRLKAMGVLWWRKVSQTDPRAGWRWLAGNWHKVAAWWLTIGLGLTALFLLVALLTWQNPQLLIMKLLHGTTALFGAGGRVAAYGAVVVLVLALPILLPGGVLAGLVVLGITVAAILFGPLLVVGAVIVSLLMLAAIFKRGGSWLLNFISTSLLQGDDLRHLAASVAAALGFTRASTTVQGKPRLLDGEEFTRLVEQNRAAPKGGEVFLGYVDGEEFRYRTEKHVFVVASARSGKGRDLIIPNLHLYPHSVFVLDPKGENCLATAEGRAARGHSIAALDPYGLTGRESTRFNPIASIQGEDMVTRADYLAEALIIGPNDHWNESARGLIRALALHLATATDEQLRGRARDLPSLRELLSGYLDGTLEDMKNSPALDGLVARLAESILDIPANERGSIISTARRGTKWLDNPQLAALFRAGDDCISFDDLREEGKKLSVYVCLPGDIFDTYPQVCRLLATFAMDTMMKKLTKRLNPVMFILDELAQLGHLPIVQRAFTLGAGYGIQVWSVFQSVEQARKLYPLDALYGSSGIRCFFKLADPESCDFASKCASGVLTPADVRFLSEFQMLTLLDGANPLMVERHGARLPRT
jgi:type IV secretion system protein VirD4